MKENLPGVIIMADARLDQSLPNQSSIKTPFGRVKYQIDHVSGRDFIRLLRRPISNLQSPISAIDPRALAYAAKALGAERVIALARDARVDRPVSPNDFIEFTSGRPATFFATIGAGYVQQNPPFCPELRQAFLWAGAEAGGTLLVVDEVPRPAARRWWAAWHIHLVSTETQPEGALCRELELCYAVLVLPAEADIEAYWPAIMDKLPAERGCGCGRLMESARQSGRLPADWREWVQPG